MFIVYLLLISLRSESFVGGRGLPGDFRTLWLHFVVAVSEASRSRRGLGLDVVLAHVESEVTTAAACRQCRLPLEIAPGYRVIYHVSLLTVSISRSTICFNIGHVCALFLFLLYE